MTKTKTLDFIKQVKQEIGRVTWPKRQEISVTTVMVLILVSISAAFFVVIDRIMYYTVQKIISLGL